MPKRAQGLTTGHLKKNQPGLFADGGGLYLQVTATQAKSWIFRFQINGKRRDMGLGSVADCGLAEARDKAADARRMVRQGIDPIAARQTEAAQRRLEQAKAMTFKQASTTFLKVMKPGWKNAKHSAQWEATLETYVYPKIGNLPVGGIDTGLVIDVLEPIWNDKTETASRVRGRIENILDFSKVRGWRSGENPARWKGHLDQVFQAKTKVRRVKHHASMDYADIPAFWPRLQLQDGMGARALELAILTATRTTEVLQARWLELDLAEKVWTIPAERMKAKSEHRVPLSDPAVALLKKVATLRRSDDGYVFHGHREGRPLSNMAMAMTLRRIVPDVTPHGFRSTFRTWAAEATAFPHDVCEAALAHTQASAVIAAYQRGDLFRKRKALMDAWAEFATQNSAAKSPRRPAGPKPPKRVHALRNTLPDARSE